MKVPGFIKKKEGRTKSGNGVKDTGFSAQVCSHLVEKTLTSLYDEFFLGRGVRMREMNLHYSN